MLFPVDELILQTSVGPNNICDFDVYASFFLLALHLHRKCWMHNGLIFPAFSMSITRLMLLRLLTINTIKGESGTKSGWTYM